MGYQPVEGVDRDRGGLILKYMQDKGYKVRAMNIVYIEGIDTDLKTLNADRLDGWNDVRAIVTDDGEVILSASATCETGGHYTYNRMNPKGAFRIAFGQYLEAWQFGKHFKQDALVQCGTIKGHRDDNEDGKRTGDIIDIGDYFGVNQHTTGNSADDSPPDAVGRWSAGCLVGRYPKTHYLQFLPMCRAMGLSRFDTTIIAGDDFIKSVRG
jgi:hypothetical protein